MRMTLDPPEPLRHSLRALRQNLEKMLRACCRHTEHSSDLLVRYVIMEEVRHRVHEHAARLFPVQWCGQHLGDEPSYIRPMPVTDKALVRHAIAAETRRHSLGIAVTAAIGNLRASAHWVPHFVGPVDGSFGHQIIPCASRIGERFIMHSS